MFNDLDLDLRTFLILFLAEWIVMDSFLHILFWEAIGCSDWF